MSYSINDNGGYIPQYRNPFNNKKDIYDNFQKNKKDDKEDYLSFYYNKKNKKNISYK